MLYYKYYDSTPCLLPYDANGRLTEKTDRNGRVTTYTYDTAGRLTSESWLDSSNNAVQSFTYTYDLSGNLLTVSDGVSSYAYTYDTMNRIDTMSFTFDGQTALFDYAYDLIGRQTQSALTLNNVADRTINIEYDYLGRALSAELTGNALNDFLAELDYNAVGALTDVRRFEWDDTDELYNLIAQSQYQYNARNQITSINHQDSNNNNIVSHGYLYDADGNITQYTNSIDGFVLYDYDFLGQLTGADYSNLSIHDESYQYDLNGNRELVTNANGDLVVYSTGTNNELNSDGNYSYAYDAEGNRISKTNAAGTERELYVWDYRNRLSSVTKQEFNTTTQEWDTVQIVEYAYDYNNVLIRKVLDANGDGVSDSKTIFLPENYQTAVQLDDADLSDSTYETVSHRYLWTPGQQDKLLADVTPTETLWTLSDHLGTIRDVVKNTPSGLLVPAHVIYDAYGNVLSCKDANGTDIESPVLFGFTGKYFDADTQLQNNVNRWYDAATGRWLSTDPIGFNGNDTNLYRYVGNGTLLLLDFVGLWKYLSGMGFFTGVLEPANPSFEHFTPEFEKYGYASSNFSLEFKPDKDKRENNCCDKIQFFQIFYMSRTNNGILGLPSKTWTVDSSEPSITDIPYPYYPYGFSNSFQSGMVSYMYDTPYMGSLWREPSGTVISQSFEVCAICGSGVNKGIVYGCIQWGHQFVITGSIWNKKVSSEKRYVNNIIWGDTMVKMLDQFDSQGRRRYLGGAGEKSYRFTNLEGLPPSEEMQKFLNKFFPN